MPEPVSVREIAVVAGLTRSQARSAVADGLIIPSALTWIDVLALRVWLPVQSMMLAGESQPRNVVKPLKARTREAVRVARDAASRDCLGRDAVLIVCRASATVHVSLGVAASKEGPGIYSEGMLLALPIGQWWSELRWRIHGHAQ